MNQRDYYKNKINKILPEFPDYIDDFVDTYYDTLSPLTLYRYLETYKNFLSWTIRETISSANNIKDVELSVLENISKKEQCYSSKCKAFLLQRLQKYFCSRYSK